MKRIGDDRQQVTPTVAIPKLGIMVEGCIFPWNTAPKTVENIELSAIQESPRPGSVEIIKSIGKTCFSDRVYFISRIGEKDRGRLEDMLTALKLIGSSSDFKQPLEYLYRDRAAAAACKRDLSHVVSTDPAELLMARTVPHRILLDTTNTSSRLNYPRLSVVVDWPGIAEIIQNTLAPTHDSRQFHQAAQV